MRSLEDIPWPFGPGVTLDEWFWELVNRTTQTTPIGLPADGNESQNVNST
jgi:hypothetical protein